MIENDENENSEEADAGQEAEPLSAYERSIWELERYDDLPPCIGMAALARHVGISKSACYERRKDGTIRATKLGGRWIVTRYELFRLLFRPDAPPESA